MSTAATARAQAAAAARSNGGPPATPRPEPPPYAGLVTRTIAFALDAGIVNVVALSVGAVLTLCGSLLHLPHDVVVVAAAVGGVAYVAWAVGYFATFWSTTGQTPGDRVMQIRVRDSGAGAPIPLRRALLRVAGLVLGAIPLFAGYVPILLDARRRAFHDWLARTVVVHGGSHA